MVKRAGPKILWLSAFAGSNPAPLMADHAWADMRISCSQRSCGFELVLSATIIFLMSFFLINECQREENKRDDWKVHIIGKIKEILKF